MLSVSSFTIDNIDMIIRKYQSLPLHILFVLIASCLIIGVSEASLGDRLHDFRDCVKV